MSLEPFLDSRINQLLKPHKTVRDPVHGDVYLNHLETEIIDTRDFQRLHGHKQLGLANRVFPGADHSRFQHSLGTLFVAGRFIETVNANALAYKDPPAVTISPYGILLTRTGALLHDMANIPFGHTLEDEGLLVEPDWNDAERVRYFFDATDPNKSPIAKCKKVLDKAELDGSAFIKNLERLLTFRGNNGNQFEYAYAADIIGNTFCADLSDYLERDAKFTGINAQYRNDRSRVIPYLFIPKEGQFRGRLVVRLWHKRFKDDVASELLFTLTLRYYLAERVYFHHTKNVLGEMLIGAVQRSDITEQQNKSLLYQMGDEDLLNWLEQAGEPSKRLVEAIRSRDLYEIVFQSSELTSQTGKASLHAEVKQLRNKITGAKYRLSLERLLTGAINDPEVKDGDILIYCPDPEGNLKVADTRVLWSVRDGIPDYVQLKELRDSKERVGRKIGNQIKTLEDEHEGLWALLVLVRASVSADCKEDIAALCHKHFKVENEVEAYSKCREPKRFDRWVAKRNVPPIEASEVLKQCTAKPRLTNGKYPQIGLPTYEELDQAYDDFKKGRGK